MEAEAQLTCPQCGRLFSPPAERCAVDGAPLYGPEVIARVGSELNNYQIHGILGEGGMGVVYKGEHVMLGKPVAIKILHNRFACRAGAATQFLREARAASRIRHPNIVDVTDFGKATDGSIFFVMEYLEGESLEDVLGRDIRLPHFDAVNVTNQIARALAAAHDNGIVHQDLKPDNVYLINREGRRRIVRRVTEGDQDDFVVEHEGKFNFVKLLDFGVAKFNEDNLGPGLTAKTGMVFGTPHYMSPEQAQGLPVDHRSDIYALGILFYEMLLGVVPFDYDSALDILNGHVSGIVVAPKDRDPTARIDDATNTTILRCLEKRPEARFQSMDELCAALTDCFTDRVFLRDAHLMPGAVEAGVVAPNAPSRPPSVAAPGQQQGAPPAAPQPHSPPAPAAHTQCSAPQGSAVGNRLPPAKAAQARPTGDRAPRNRQRLTDELAELFGGSTQEVKRARQEPEGAGPALLLHKPRGSNGPTEEAPGSEPARSSTPADRVALSPASEPTPSPAASGNQRQGSPRQKTPRTKTQPGLYPSTSPPRRKRRSTAPLGTKR